MTVRVIPSPGDVFTAPDSALELVNYDHSRAIWLGVFAILAMVIVFITLSISRRMS